MTVQVGEADRRRWGDQLRVTVWSEAHPPVPALPTRLRVCDDSVRGKRCRTTEEL